MWRFRIRSYRIHLLYPYLLIFSFFLTYAIFGPPSIFLPANLRWRMLLFKYSKISYADLGDPCGDDGFHPALLAIMTWYRSCLSRKMQSGDQKAVWPDLHRSIAYCLDEQFWKLLNVRIVHNWSDTKLIILRPPPRKIQPHKDEEAKNDNDDSCIEVTLGIGEDIAAELNLRKLIPDCRFYGADPVHGSGVIFKKVGKYFELAIAGKSGDVRSKVLENMKYEKRNFQAVSFADFLKSYAEVSHVDYFFMDIEGGEYSILEEMTTGGSVDRSKIPICQISVELHPPSEMFGTNETTIRHSINRLIWHSSFVPVWTSDTYLQVSGLATQYYINVGEPYCVQKYLKSNFCR